MRIARQYSRPRRSPYEGIRFRSVFTPHAGDGGTKFGIEVPVGWSQEAGEALAHNCLRKDGIPTRLKPVAERDVPRWLWRSTADEAALAKLPADRRYGPETDARKLFDRIAGAWTYQGWQSGYFDSAPDAEAFFDETRAMMCRQIALPDGVQIRHAGLYWAYGIKTGADGACITDYRTGVVTRAGDGHLPPHGAYIQDVTGNVAGDGGIMDLWQREARLLADGVGTASNVSRVGGDDAATGLVDMLRVGDAAAGTVRRDGRGVRPPRMLTLDADHPEAIDFIRWKPAEEQRTAALIAGTKLADRHLDAIAAACRRPGRKGNLNPERNPALKFSLIAAQKAMLPATSLDRVMDLARQGRTGPNGAPVGTDATVQAVLTAGAQNGLHVLRIDDHVLGRLTADGDRAAEDSRGDSRDGETAALWDALAEATWTTGETGVLFATTVDEWHTCPNSGPIRGSAANGDFMFLDDVACGTATLNLGAFLGGARTFDTEGFAHAARLWSIVLDITVMMTALPTPRLAARSWEFRPLGLGFTNLGGLLTAAGIGYDSDAGRALCAAAASLMTGTAYATSAELAAELGPFPAFGANRKAMMKVIRNHRMAASGEAGGYHGLNWTPLAFRPADCPDPRLAAAARDVWDDALGRGGSAGFRNAQVSLVAQAAETGLLMDGNTLGIEPDFAMVRFEKLPGGGFHKVINPAVPLALGALGYGERRIEAIVRHVVGHGSLADAPGVNHEALRRRGFTEAALATLEAALPATLDISFVFNKWTLGEDFCARMLAFSKADFEDDGFDMLAALGFSPAAIEAANIHCCGANTLGGAREIEPRHLAVFDCPRSLGERGRRRLSTESLIRMMAAAQPFISGAVGHAIALPASTGIDDIKAAYLLAWRLGLKMLMLDRDESRLDHAGAWTAMRLEEGFTGDFGQWATFGTAPSSEVARRRGRFLVYDGGEDRKPAQVAAAPERGDRMATGNANAIARSGMSQALAIALTARDLARSAEEYAQQERNNGTCSPGAATAAAPAAETSRRPASDAPRGKASAASSVDAFVEQRQV
jgi:ribonucleoside-diphosphate reductase alpha chain